MSAGSSGCLLHLQASTQCVVSRFCNLGKGLFKWMQKTIPTAGGSKRQKTLENLYSTCIPFTLMTWNDQLSVYRHFPCLEGSPVHWWSGKWLFRTVHKVLQPLAGILLGLCVHYPKSIQILRIQKSAISLICANEIYLHASPYFAYIILFSKDQFLNFEILRSG